MLRDYPETAFGGELPFPPDYRGRFMSERIARDGWALWPPIRFDARSINYARPAPAPPSAENWLGTDDQGRDVLARVIYGLRLSILFALGLTLASSLLGICAGAVQGYYGGWIDLFGQRFIEVWSGLPMLYLLIILASLVQPGSAGCWRSCCCSPGPAWSTWFAPSSCAVVTWSTSRRRGPSASATPG